MQIFHEFIFKNNGEKRIFQQTPQYLQQKSEIMKCKKAQFVYFYSFTEHIIIFINSTAKLYLQYQSYTNSIIIH